MNTENVAVHTSSLTDLEMRALIRCYETFAADDTLSLGLQTWYADLAIALRQTVATRTWLWLALVDHMNDTMRLPRNWDAAVAALPTQGGGEAA